jgi:hypothetical protein
VSLWGSLKTWLIVSPGHSSEIDNPATMSPTVQSWQSNLALVRALYGGFQALYAGRTQFLPQHPKEDKQDYEIRSRRPTFYNAFARTVRGLAGMVCNTPPTPEGVPKEILALYEDDIDNEGTDGPSFVRRVFQDGLVPGLVGIFVNQQGLVGENLTRADELTAGIRPYWELVRMDDIRSFRTTTEAGRVLLEQLVFCEKRQVPVGQFGVKEVERIRVYQRLPRREAGDTDSLPPTVREILYEKDGRGKYVIVSERDLPSVEEIPLAVIYTGDRLAFLDAQPPLLDLAHVNLLHYQTQSDMHHAVHISNVPFLFGIGIKEGDLEIGPNRAVLVEDGDERTTMRWVEHTGAQLGSTRAILSDLEEQMAHLGLGMLQRKSRAAETAEKASLDKKDQDSVLAGIVTELEDGLERALFYTSQYLGLATWGRFAFTRDFEVEPEAAARTENQGTAQNPKEPAPPGNTNNPATRNV